ncbi:prepilin peptidase [Levilactobacillus huananensis]|uniref:prepilin peptidase n=1 Tax=Levilactobacillus huananensis TaxID=2486019 RepID=UPI000F77311D|nr:A24 family peptidase [Levilactobacillus huananensis]
MSTFFLFCYGCCFGSLIGATSSRYARHESPNTPGSHCDTCQTPLRPWQLIPILSYLYQRGRCHTCHAAIPLQTLILEISGGWLATTITGPATLLTVIWLYLWGYAALCDAATQTFPSIISWLSLPVLFWTSSPLIWGLAMLWLLGIRLIWPSLSEPLIGDGDLEFIGLYGLAFGVQALAWWLLTACLLALVINRHFPGRIALIPYLTSSALGWWLYS